jgi:hypothetical protein
VKPCAISASGANYDASVIMRPPIPTTVQTG